MKNVLKRTFSLGMAIILVFAACRMDAAAATVDNQVAWENYGQIIYNSTNGLMSNHVTSIAQTVDGNVWIGTDEGLVAFDGNEFSEYGGFYHFDGINDMVMTAAGGVWYATTTYGGAINLGSRFQHFDNVKEGTSNFATTICEATDGSVYVGTLRSMLRIDVNAGFVVTEYAAPDYYYVVSVSAANNNRVMGVNIEGDIFFLRDGEEIYREYGVVSGQVATAYCDGYFLVGCQNGQILVYNAERPELGVLGHFFIQNGQDVTEDRINNFYVEDNRLWVLMENHIGYVDMASGNIESMLNKQVKYTECHFEDFESGYTDMMKDYQGNYWITSSKRGVLLLRSSMFTDEFAQLGLDIDVVNSVSLRGNELYVACQSGLIVINKNTKSVINNLKTGVLAGKCVKDVAFAGNDIYVAVYGEGVYLLDAREGMVSGASLVVENLRVRRLVISSGVLYALTDDGAYVIEDGRAVDSYTGTDGLYRSQVTSILTGCFGRNSEDRIYIGSDGAGIYVFKDGELENIIDENDGLPSKTVNDMVAYGQGFFIATDSGIAYFNGRKIAELKKLPKGLSDMVCEQIFISNDELFAFCQNAIYAIELKNLFGTDESLEVKYDLYDAQSGFFGNLSADGRGYMDEAGRMYLPCNDKVYSFLGIREKVDVMSLKIMLQSVKADERMQTVSQTGDNEYYVKLSKDVKNVDIFCSVLNFSSEDPYIAYILHGVDNAQNIVRNSELEHITYEELPGGTYTFWFDILDDEGQMAQRIVLTIDKEKSLFEKLWVRMVGLAAGFGLLMYFVFKDKKPVIKTEVDK